MWNNNLMYDENISEFHSDGTNHIPDWTSLAHADVPSDVPLFDVNCIKCGQSGSFMLSEEDIQW
jgi:hypothetical protein